MSLRIICILFLLLSIAAGTVAFSMETPRTGILIDVTFVAAISGFLFCVIALLGRHFIELADEDQH